MGHDYIFLFPASGVNGNMLTGIAQTKIVAKHDVLAADGP